MYTMYTLYMNMDNCNELQMMQDNNLIESFEYIEANDSWRIIFGVTKNGKTRGMDMADGFVGGWRGKPEFVKFFENQKARLSQ